MSDTNDKIRIVQETVAGKEITQANRRLDAAAVKGGGEPCPSMD